MFATLAQHVIYGFASRYEVAIDPNISTIDYLHWLTSGVRVYMHLLRESEFVGPDAQLAINGAGAEQRVRLCGSRM